MEKFAVALINHKGGVGKTSLSYILAQIGLSKGLSVAVVDMDPQRNLSKILRLTAARNPDEYQALTISETLTDLADFIVVDCPPALNEATVEAIDFADIILVPVMADVFSISNLAPVYNFAKKQGKGIEQIAIVKVGFDKRALVEMIASVLDETEYHIAGNVPINRLIPYNIAMGNSWEYRTPKFTREPYHNLYSNIWNAYKEMVNGDFENAWKKEDEQCPD